MGSSTLRIVRLTLYLAWTLALMPVQGLGLILRCRWVRTLPVFYHRWCCRILAFRVQLIGTPTARRPVLFAVNPTPPADLAATVYRSLGVDPATELRDRLNRPIRLCHGEEIAPLFNGSTSQA